MILANQNKRGAAYASIFERYGASEDGPPDLPEDAFAAVGARKSKSTPSAAPKKAAKSSKQKSNPR